MREIKFRAWDKLRKKFLAWQEIMGFCDFSWIFAKTDGVTNFGTNRFIPEQFTGLHDKNGVEIYEGDIVHLYGEDRVNKYDWKAVVEFGNPNGLYSWGYQLKPIAEFRYNVDILAWIEMEECGIYAEVIGNIHEKEN